MGGGRDSARGLPRQLGAEQRRDRDGGGGGAAEASETSRAPSPKCGRWDFFSAGLFDPLKGESALKSPD